MTLRVHGSGVGSLPLGMIQLRVRNDSMCIEDSEDTFGRTLFVMSLGGMA